MKTLRFKPGDQARLKWIRGMYNYAGKIPYDATHPWKPGLIVKITSYSTGQEPSWCPDPSDYNVTWEGQPKNYDSRVLDEQLEPLDGDTKDLELDPAYVQLKKLLTQDMNARRTSAPAKQVSKPKTTNRSQA